MAGRIADQFEQHGMFGDGVAGSDAGSTTSRLHVANTTAWTDDEAREAFRSALVGEVNKGIVTPGWGDTPLWTSSQIGSLVTQFKKFGMASYSRVLISGLQDHEMNFWSGAMALVGIGAMADYIKAQYADNDVYAHKPWQEKLVSAMDRAAVLGWPLGAGELAVGAAVMLNVLGAASGPAGTAAAHRLLSAALATPGASAHWYGKEAQPKRKCGHITVVGPTGADVDAKLAHIRAAAAAGDAAAAARRR
jgi:hypothetical protein